MPKCILLYVLDKENKYILTDFLTLNDLVLVTQTNYTEEGNWLADDDINWQQLVLTDIVNDTFTVINYNTIQCHCTNVTIVTNVTGNGSKS